MSSHFEILQKLLQEKIVAILRLDDSETLPDLCGAVAEGGILAQEITMTVPRALHWLEKTREALPSNVLLGAGTILDAETARLAILAGADFLVSPHTDVEIIKTAKRYGKPILPGAFTPTEILHAWEAGADIVKLFPSDPMGPKYLKNLRGPLPQIRYMPTGGVTLDTIHDFFTAGACAVGVGSVLCNKEWIANRDWERIREEAAKFAAVRDSL